MRTPEDGPNSPRRLHDLAQATPHADEALVYILRAMELEAAHKPGREQVSPAHEQAPATSDRSAAPRRAAPPERHQ